MKVTMSSASPPVPAVVVSPNPKGPASQICSKEFSTAAANTTTTTEDEIRRGRTIDFYRLKDPLALAAWATFFRDRHFVASSKFELTKFLFSLVQDEILLCPSMEAVFRAIPFFDTESLPTKCFQVIFKHFEGGTGSGKVHPMDNPAWKEFLWEGKPGTPSLSAMIQKAHTTHLMKYASRISRLLDSFLGNFSDDAEREHVKHELLLVSSGGTGLTIVKPYETIKSFYALLHRSNMEPSAAFSVMLVQQDQIQQDLNGKLVSDIFTEDEEAFILSVVGSYLANDNMGLDGDESENAKGHKTNDLNSLVYRARANLASAKARTKQMVDNDDQLSSMFCFLPDVSFTGDSEEANLGVSAVDGRGKDAGGFVSNTRVLRRGPKRRKIVAM